MRVGGWEGVGFGIVCKCEHVGGEFDASWAQF